MVNDFRAHKIPSGQRGSHRFVPSIGSPIKSIDLYYSDKQACKTIRMLYKPDHAMGSSPRQLRVTWYPRTKSSGPQSKIFTLDWPGNAIVALSDPCATTDDREQVPLLMAGTTDGERGDAHVLSRSMLVFDIDCKRSKPDLTKDDPGESDKAWQSRSGKVSAAFDRACVLLQQYAHTWHTTHSHDGGINRLGWRVWLPLEEDLPASDLGLWRSAMQGANHTLFSMIADHTTYNPERLMRLPATHPDRLAAFRSGVIADAPFLTIAQLRQIAAAAPRLDKTRVSGSPPLAKSYAVASGSFPLGEDTVTLLRKRCGEWAYKEIRLAADTIAALRSIALGQALDSGQRDNGVMGLLGVFANRLLEFEAGPLLESLLLPVLELITQAEMAVDEIIDVAGRATIEAILTLSA